MKTFEKEGTPFYEWEHVMLSPDLRPYVSEIHANPFGPGTSEVPSSGGGSRPFYHPALNPQTALKLAMSTPEGFQHFNAYMRWLRTPGVAEQLGFTATEIASFERMTMFGGQRFDLPHAGSTGYRSNLQSAPSGELMRGYLDWVGRETALDGGMMSTARAAVDASHGAGKSSGASSEASLIFSKIAGWIRAAGGIVQELRIGPNRAVLEADTMGDMAAAIDLVEALSRAWTINDSSYRGVLLLHTSEAPSSAIDAQRRRFDELRIPSGLEVRVLDSTDTVSFER